MGLRDDFVAAAANGPSVAERVEGKFLEPEKCAEVFLEEFERITSEPAGFGIMTGIKPLDALVRGMRGGNVYFVVGDPSNGKTALGTQISVNAAVSGKSVALVSLEMPLYEMECRIIGSMSGLSMADIENAAGPYGKIGLLLTKVTERKKLKLSVLDGAGITLQNIIEELQEYASTHPIDLLVIDYAQYIVSAGPEPSGNRQEESTRISRGIKQLAKRAKIPILCLAQLRKRDVRAEDHRPTPERIRESGAFEQDASVIIGIHWPHRYDAAREWDECELYVSKNRNGACGTLTIGADWTSSRFFDAPRPKEEK